MLNDGEYVKGEGKRYLRYSYLQGEAAGPGQITDKGQCQAVKSGVVSQQSGKSVVLARDMTVG